MAKITHNKTFANREELDAYVRSNFGEDQTANKDITLELTAVEMTALSLDETSKVYGTKVRLKTS